MRLRLQLPASEELMPSRSLDLSKTYDALVHLACGVQTGNPSDRYAAHTCESSGSRLVKGGAYSLTIMNSIVY